MTIGLPGFIIFLGIGATLIIKGLFIILRMNNSYFRLLSIAAYTYVCQQYLAIVAVDSFHTLPTAFYFWVCAGLLFVLEELDDKKVEESTTETLPADPSNLVPTTSPS